MCNNVVGVVMKRIRIPQEPDSIVIALYIHILYHICIYNYLYHIQRPHMVGIANTVAVQLNPNNAAADCRTCELTITLTCNMCIQ